MAAKTTARRPVARSPRSAWEQPGIVDNPDAPAQRQFIRNQKWARRAINIVAYGAIPVIAFASLSMFASARASDEVSGQSVSSEAANSSRGKPEAYRAVEEWIAADPSPLPGGRVVSWDGFSVEKPPVVENPESSGQTVYEYTHETHRFTVEREGIMFLAAVEIAVSDSVGAVVTATPSLSPIAVVEDFTNGTWFNLTEATATPATAQAVEAWATAFTSGSADALHQIVQDRNTDRAYIPLTGVDELISASVIAAGTSAVGETAEGDGDLVVRVELKFWWAGQKPVSSEMAAQDSPAPVTYDLLLHHADTATPVVVAWGAPGSGPKLVAYANAVRNDPSSGAAPTATNPEAPQNVPVESTVPEAPAIDVPLEEGEHLIEEPAQEVTD